jgi:hypothetical protein
MKIIMAVYAIGVECQEESEQQLSPTVPLTGAVCRVRSDGWLGDVGAYCPRIAFMAIATILTLATTPPSKLSVAMRR